MKAPANGYLSNSGEGWLVKFCLFILHLLLFALVSGREILYELTKWFHFSSLFFLCYSWNYDLRWRQIWIWLNMNFFWYLKICWSWLELLTNCLLKWNGMEFSLPEWLFLSSKIWIINWHKDCDAFMSSFIFLLSFLKHHLKKPSRLLELLF